MVKAIPSGNGSWTVEISTLKKQNESIFDGKSPGKVVEIRKSRTLINNDKPRSLLNNFADASKSRVEKIVQHAIESVKNWQRDMLAKIDVTHQHILRMHNLQIASYCQAKTVSQPESEESKSAESENEQPIEPGEVFPSMPILMDENCNDVKKFPPKPIGIARKKIFKRRNAIYRSPPDQTCSSPDDIHFDIPLRRNPRFVHSSAIAIAKKQLTFENQNETRTVIKTETLTAKYNGSNMNKLPKSGKLKQALVQKLLETRKLVMENQKRVQEANMIETAEDEFETADDEFETAT